MYEFRELAKDVYAFLQPPLVWYSNAGVIVGDKDVIVVDSLANAAMTKNLLSEIRRVTDKPIRFLINTHSHADHVYTNHLFPEATVITTHSGREQTKANLELQGEHSASYAKFFPEFDFSGGRYTVQDMCFRGTFSLYQGAREVRVIELGAGHSESDVVVYLPSEKIAFCGDVFLKGMPPLPLEGHVSQTIAHYKLLESFEAEVYVPGHGEAGTLAHVRVQREQLERQFERARECFQKGMSYDEALRAFAGDVIPLEFQRVVILASYCEFTGRHPETKDPASQSHMSLIQSVADELRVLLGTKEVDKKVAMSR
ncbi:MBL fold metallo-hydrolase [Geomonas sp. RF6]|uniref:MBL fold metallo-hydrolase n=1 Tax=Geomonas sp. RF6 TaxID=2897342 RepID=UPI001E4E636D|nr:MBL fold metallo-hydrolase [Geomonas sp. RF6]UFS71177.1 MBL fold metallo-hydrolase [Geomonas sp. RF6]